MKKKNLVLMGIIILVIFMIPVFYYFKLDDNFNDKPIEIGITINGEYTDTFPLKESGLGIQDITCDNGATGVWSDEEWSFSVTNLTTTRTKCSINFYSIPYQEEILNGMDPVLKEGLIPVTISDDGVVQKADLYSEWYSYANQKWANAVILENESITYEEGEEIPESNIESYFVWIPRYKYKLFNLGNYTSVTSLNNNAIQDIEIFFGDDTTNDENEGECTTPMESGSSGNCQVGDYMTHPAFLSFNVNGLWVGKFETGYKGATSAAAAQTDDYDITKVQIKPNVYSWRQIHTARAHLNSYNYKREMDSHMMKNTEWGAVAYLQHSVYGSRSSVRINNNSNYITGYAAKKEPTTGYTGSNAAGNIYEGTSLGVDGTNTYNYKNPLSVSASTTNNYSGIYDMSGGSHEMVMGVMLSSTGQPCAGIDSERTSAFSGPYCGTSGTANGFDFPAAKYYDKYLYSTSGTSYTRRILGDATGEMGAFAKATYVNQTLNINSWYADGALVILGNVPWIARGYSYNFGINTGVFAFHQVGGHRYVAGGFRIVLAF